MKIELVAYQKSKHMDRKRDFNLQNVVIKSFAELDVNALGPALYKLEQELDQDIPNMKTAPQRTLNEFISHRLTGSDIDKDCFFIALDQQGQPVGMCATRSRGDDLHIGMTGVKGCYRGQGLATALKQGVIEAATTTPYLV